MFRIWTATITQGEHGNNVAVSKVERTQVRDTYMAVFSATKNLGDRTVNQENGFLCAVAAMNGKRVLAVAGLEDSVGTPEEIAAGLNKVDVMFAGALTLVGFNELPPVTANFDGEPHMPDNELFNGDGAQQISDIVKEINSYGTAVE